MKKLLLAGLGAALVTAGAVGVAGAQNYIRPDGRSNANLRYVRQTIDRDIATMQHDQRDYGGHRVAAIKDLQNARAEINAAEQYDRNH